jgi:Fe2+ transport system protein FeoA
MNARPAPILLTLLPAGHTARLHETQLDPESVGLLRALGLCETECFRLCKAGEPCILQVGATRIGVSKTVASKIYVIPDAPAAVARR